jgi:hypothetical protein
VSDLHVVKNIKRFPRLMVIPEGSRTKYNAMEEEVCLWLKRGREARIEAGRLLRKLKRQVIKDFGHGHWELYLEERFEHWGVAPRTARTWMELSRKRDREIKTADSAVFKPGTHQQAMAMAKATTEAERNIGVRVFKLPLPLLGDQEREAVRAFLKSDDWKTTQQEIIQLLKRRIAEKGKANATIAA